MNKEFDQAKSAVITVGEGRGFVVNGRAYFANGPHDRLIITAAHCLPFLPPCDRASYLEDRTYKALLAPLGGKPSVWAECLFADPVADIAILGRPDNQASSDRAAEYDTLVDSTTPLPISDAPEQGHGRLLSLDGRWFRCTIRIINDGPLWISETEEPIEGGMSGSPVISDEAAATGIICVGSDTDPGESTGWTNPRLVRDLPGWFLRLQQNQS